MSPQHAEAIKQHYRTALALKCDPEKHEAILAIRKRATELNISANEVTSLYREVLSEKSKPAPQKELPRTKERKDRVGEIREITEKNPKNLGTRRGRQTVEPMRERKDSDSAILRMADEKRK